MHSDHKSRGCQDDVLVPNTRWKWDANGSGCKLHMYGDKKCTGKDGLNFDARGVTDNGHAETYHLAWKVDC